MNTTADAADAHRPRCEDRRVQDPAHHLCRRVLVGDGRLRRPRAAGHDVSRAPRLHQRCSTARSPMPTARRTRSASRSCETRSRRAAVSRTCCSISARGSACPAWSTTTAPRNIRAATRSTSSSTNARPASACSPAGAARDGRARASARRIRISSRATSSTAATGTRSARRGPLLQDGEPRLSRVGEVARLRRLDRAGRAAVLLGDAAALPSRGARPRRRAAAASAIASASRATSIRCRSGTQSLRRTTPTTETQYPLSAITQRPMFMYHAWGSQNRWLRQIATRNVLYLHPDTARDDGHRRRRLDLDRLAARTHPRAGAHARGDRARHRVDLERDRQAQGRVEARARRAGVPRGIPFQSPDRRALPARRDGIDYANADPVTGQAAWFDLRVRIERDDESQEPGHRIEVGAA